MNCFHFTIETLISKGYNIPLKWEGLEYSTEKDKINMTPNFYIESKKLQDYIYSFTKKVDNAEKNDIIIHLKGLGIAINEYKFMTLTHFNIVKIFPILKSHVIRRVT